MRRAPAWTRDLESCSRETSHNLSRLVLHISVHQNSRERDSTETKSSCSSRWTPAPSPNHSGDVRFDSGTTVRFQYPIGTIDRSEDESSHGRLSRTCSIRTPSRERAKVDSVSNRSRNTTRALNSQIRDTLGRRASCAASLTDARAQKGGRASSPPREAWDWEHSCSRSNDSSRRTAAWRPTTHSARVRFVPTRASVSSTRFGKQR